MLSVDEACGCCGRLMAVDVLSVARQLFAVALCTECNSSAPIASNDP